MMTPIIFLDIDGVLTIREMHRVFRSGNRYPNLIKGQRGFSRAAVANLNRLVSRVAAQIVVSSSWRMDPNCRQRLLEAGIGPAFHDDWCTDTDGPDRGSEISRWLSRNGSPPYVLLDDWPHELSTHAHRLVNTDFRVGLQARDLARALDVLRA
ncbi:HAD domain-containing protein [Acidisoma silvae]|uniref:Uncharacterized protein n=1 Tax=Acidisoma silvae TaxID=2802396 RepID=A0A964E0W5_9PROT|nr:HAD domain-containing protein [Acidisoma silvae]MCB8877592.1 hypothetical protein [Acidisoma silvae]